MHPHEPLLTPGPSHHYLGHENRRPGILLGNVGIRTLKGQIGRLSSFWRPSRALCAFFPTPTHSGTPSPAPRMCHNPKLTKLRKDLCETLVRHPSADKLEESDLSEPLAPSTAGAARRRAWRVRGAGPRRQDDRFDPQRGNCTISFLSLVLASIVLHTCTPSPPKQKNRKSPERRNL